MMRSLALLLLLLPQEAPTAWRLDAAEFARRRAAVAEKLPDGAAALDAGPLGEPGADANTPVFDFRYLAGIHDDQGLLVLLDGKLTVFVSKPADIPEAAVLPLEGFAAWAKEHLAGKKIYTKLRQKNLDALRAAAPGADVVGSTLGPALTRLRLVKSEAEIRLIRKSSDATNKAHLAVMRATKPGKNEKELDTLLRGVFAKEGCDDIGFPPIVGAGRNGTVLHYMENKKPIPPDTLMVVDIGASILNYVTDITRTLPTSGAFSETQRTHYQCVLDAQKAAEAVLKPGATFWDLERAAKKVFEDRELTKWSYAHSKDNGVRHGLGHYVGLAVHDSGTYREKFAPGMVITIEPGWYDKDAGYGIRIEDMYLITADGFERLSADAPREIAEIEKAMRPKDF
ncbi:MAG TPA: Xaa-Pro peptidase family protein [Planctomycetota bacterium]